jgi:hypothetical protein
MSSTFRAELMNAYQRALIFTSMEDISAIDVLGEIAGGQFGSEQIKWRVEVANFLYRNLLGGFIKLKSVPGLAYQKSTHSELRELFLSKSPECSGWVSNSLQPTI